MLASADDSGATGRPVETAVRSAARGRRLILAVSGGRDSMALLHAAARVARGSVAVVATFDHRTGDSASRASALVARDAATLGLPVVIGTAKRVGSSEAEWRSSRLEFLKDVANRVGGAVVTAHTRDDQIETVLMRILRDAGARGLAGLFAAGDTVRPLLELSRAEVAAYARAVGAAWIEDPTNDSPRFLRNRVRRDLLPALERVSPNFQTQVLAIAREAAIWRRRLDVLVAATVRVEHRRGGVAVHARDLAGFSSDELAVLWPAIAAHAGVVADWRGTERVAAFTINSRAGARMPLSGGWVISRTRDGFDLKRGEATELPAPRALAPGTRWNGWTFKPAVQAPQGADAWTAQLPEDAPLSVRRWRAGDRMRVGPDGRTRRVKRFLSDARLSGVRRERWPVVLAGDEVVWIPGVRRSDVAAVQAGRPGVLYVCECDDS